MQFFEFVLFLVILAACECNPFNRFIEDKRKCPKVRSDRNFDLQELLGTWYIVEYYASSEEALAYKCMKAELSLSPVKLDVTMNFSYSFVDDPVYEQLLGNITWSIPDMERPAHWIHAEDTYEGVYNTYVLDSDYKSWTLLLHCAEKSNDTRYLSSFIMSREPLLGVNVINYLRDKLLRYDVDLNFMFPMVQDNCDPPDFAKTSPNPGFVDYGRASYRKRYRNPLNRIKKI